MSNERVENQSTSTAWRSTQVYTMGVICLVVGVAIGYLFRGSQSPARPTQAQVTAAGAAATRQPGQMPSLDQMRRMADTKAQPLLDKLKADPNNSGLLFQVGNIYQATHQFKVAQEYYEKALQIDPRNLAIRTELASCLYYAGDADGAIRELQESLRQSPNDANSLFNLGMIRWQSRHDANGALEAWQELLKSNPKLSADRKAAVQKLIANVKQQGKPASMPPTPLQN